MIGIFKIKNVKEGHCKWKSEVNKNGIYGVW